MRPSISSLLLLTLTAAPGFCCGSAPMLGGKFDTFVLYGALFFLCVLPVAGTLCKRTLKLLGRAALPLIKRLGTLLS